jgi:uridine kinase
VSPIGRTRVLARLAEHLRDWRVPHPLRVAVDGPDAAGKTWLAEDMAHLLRLERDVIRISVDAFH